MPQLNPEFYVSQLFWLVITFSFLLFFLWRISLPRIRSVLTKRERKIQEDLNAAKEMQKEAQNIEESIEEKLRKAKDESSDHLRSTLLSLQEITTNELSKIDEELEIKINESEDLIKKNKQKSLEQINTQINEITKLTLKKIGNFDFNDQDIKNEIKFIEGQFN